MAPADHNGLEDKAHGQTYPAYQRTAQKWQTVPAMTQNVS
jgi:hypothetical protein